MELAPALFLSHGSPLNILADNSFSSFLRSLSSEISLPSTILVISAHHITSKLEVGISEKMETIYDFYGFPDELYRVDYKPPGNPALVDRIRNLFPGEDIISTSRGLDHGAWSVLRHLYPDQNVPVVPISMKSTWDLKLASEFSLILKELRKENVLILGSGNITHNLGRLDFANPDADVMKFASDFDNEIKLVLESGDFKRLLNPGEWGSLFREALPTIEHYFPAVMVAYSGFPGEKLKQMYEGFQHGSISMRCFGYI